jgi:hypothetical protein
MMLHKIEQSPRATNDGLNEYGYSPNFMGEPLLQKFDVETRLLAWLSMVRLCTAGQVARYLFGGDAERAYALLERMRGKRMLGRSRGIRLPKGAGAAAGPARFYYLAERGRDTLGEYHPTLANSATVGAAARDLVGKAAHELAVTDSYLWWREQGFTILDFANERILQSRKLQQSRAGGIGPRDEAVSESVGDYQVVLLNVAEGGVGIETVQCEIAISYTAQKMSKKPRNMRWFVCDSTQADKVISCAKTKPVMLRNVCEPRPEAERRALSEPRGRARKQGGNARELIAALEAYGGCATAAGVMALAGGWRGNVSRELRAMAKRGILKRYTVQLVPGETEGRPLSLYSLDPSAEMPLVARQHAAYLSKAAAYMAGAGYGPRLIDVGLGVIVLHDPAEKEAAEYVVTVDDPKYKPGGIYQVMQRARAKHRGTNCIFVVAAAKTSRIEALREQEPRLIVWDLKERFIHGHMPASLASRRHAQRDLQFEIPGDDEGED